MAASLSAPKLGAAGTVDLQGDAFAADWNEHLVWHVVRNELLWRRQGTHSTKTRGMVKGGGAKPWRQKGTGRARQGTTRAPQWRSGGVVFGPSPRQYGGKVNKKERVKALHAALTLHANRGSFAVLPDDSFADAPSTKAAAALRTGWDFAYAAKKLTVICTIEQENVWKSFRNLEDVIVVASSDIDVADVLWGRGLVVTEAVLAQLEGQD
ncbi:MAG: ribosomal protein L4/L1e [Thermoleophilia bacterium]|nr:ribosomal protein L4/L1e [Thermoleophilia bacterium]